MLRHDCRGSRFRLSLLGSDCGVCEISEVEICHVVAAAGQGPADNCPSELLFLSRLLKGGIPMRQPEESTDTRVDSQ